MVSTIGTRCRARLKRIEMASNGEEEVRERDAKGVEGKGEGR